MDDVPLFEIAWDREDIKNVVDSVGRGGYWAKGPYVSEFEERLESYLGVEHALVVNSGTTAIECALRGHGIGPGDEVIIPSFTFIATANAVSIVDADPVFADVERETYGLDPESVREHVTEDTAAILPVHVYGEACRIEELRAVADEHGVPLIEDAAEALGATHDGEKVGTFGDSAALSFCQNKIAATGEGGAVITDDPEVAARVEQYRDHGRVSDDYFDSAGSGKYTTVGSNYRMADLVAALGCSQMEKVESLIEGRRTAAASLNGRIDEIPGVDPPAGSDRGRHVYQIYSVTFDRDVDREVVVETLSDHGISSKVYWSPPVHRTQCYDRERSLPVSDDLAERVLALPIHPELDEQTITHVTNALETAVDAAR